MAGTCFICFDDQAVAGGTFPDLCAAACTYPCAECRYDLGMDELCLECERYYEMGVEVDSGRRVCVDVCGDGVNMDYYCDMEKGVRYDGCTD